MPPSIFSHNRLLILLPLICFLACDQPSSVPDGFQVEPGFTLRRVAAEPLIKDPVDMAFNELGDAMVLEMPGYPFEDKQSRIVVLKDNDQDGEYDDKLVFVENLQLANSFLPYKKGVLVAAPPYLLFVHDENQDYQPEKVDTLMGGFSTGNLQHNYNSLTMGLDNWIYAANGGNDGAPYWWNDSTNRTNLRGQDFRFNLVTHELERLGESSGGFGLAIDEYGQVFETHNMEHVSHLVFPDRYVKGRRMLQNHTLENISDHEVNGLARIYPIGEQESRVNHPEQSGYFSGSCGITYYGGGAFGVEYDNTVWVADVVLNLIHVDKLTPNGGSFTASRQLENHDFLASTDRSFRPVNMEVGPDGHLYVVDIYRKVIEHPEWIPDDIEKTLDLEAGKDQGRIYRIAKLGVESSFDADRFKNEEEMVKSLSHPNQWVRKTAHRLLMDKPISTVTKAQLISNLKAENDMTRLHAMWLLETKESLDNKALLALIQDKTPGLRQAALSIAEGRLGASPELLTVCLASLSDASQQVRMQAALSLSTLSSQKATAIKVELLDAIQSAAMLPSDRWNMAAYSLAVGDLSAELLASLLSNSSVQVPTDFLNSLALSAATTQPDLESVLTALARSSLPPSFRQPVVEQLTNGLGNIDGKSLEPFIRPLEQSGDLAMITALAGMRSKLGLGSSAQYQMLSREALKKVLDSSQPDSVRLQQLALLELLPYGDKSTVLFACLNNSQPLKLQENALRQLSKYNEKAIGEKVVSMWNELSPTTRRYASDLLLYIEANNDALLTGLENGTINIGEMNFDLERRRQLLWWTDNESTKRRAEKLFSDSGVSNRKDAIEKMKPALALQGSALNGGKVFETVCANCHIYGSKGNEVGPALTEIARKSKETLMHDILDPNAAADTKYINHLLETQDGEVHVGIVAAENDQNITIRKMGGENITVGKADIKSFRSLGTSLMMEGLENSMTQQEMADLLSFLQNGVD